MTDYWNAGIVPPSDNISPEVSSTQAAQEELPSYEGSTGPSHSTEMPKEEKVEHKYRAVRGSGDPVYLIIDNKKHWVLTADVFKKLGYKLGEEEKVENSELATYLPGETITPENYEKYL